MIGAFGEVLVMDWGLALTETRPNLPPNPDSNLAQPVVAGTAGFMAPEQARGAADARSDVYALGALLALVSGAGTRRPRRGCPRPLKSIAAKARATDPAARYATAEAFAADLSRYLDAQAVTAHRESLARAHATLRAHLPRRDSAGARLPGDADCAARVSGTVSPELPTLLASASGTGRLTHASLRNLRRR